MEKTTIYYRKSTGIIDSLCPLENDMSWYGDLSDEYSLTHDFVVIDKDDYVINNLSLFKVVDGKLKLKSDNLSKYV